MSRRSRIGWVVGLAALACAAWWYSGAAKLSYSSFSPRGAYRLDVYQSLWLGRLLHFNDRLPGFVRLHRVDPPQLLGESAVVDLNDNAQVFWMMDFDGKVSVGMDITFENIPPECKTTCPAAPQASPGTVKP